MYISTGSLLLPKPFGLNCQNCFYIIDRLALCIALPLPRPLVAIFTKVSYLSNISLCLFFTYVDHLIK